MPTRAVFCRYAPPDAKGHLRPTVWGTPQWATLAAASCYTREVRTPPHDATLAAGSPCLLFIEVPPAQVAALGNTFTALDELPETRVFANLRGGDAPSAGQRVVLRAILNAFGLDGAAASAQAATFGDFLRFVAVSAWGNSALPDESIS